MEAFGGPSIYSHTAARQRIQRTYHVHKILEHSMMGKRVKENRPGHDSRRQGLWPTTSFVDAQFASLFISTIPAVLSSTGLINMLTTHMADSLRNILPRFLATHSLFGLIRGKLDAIKLTVRTFGYASTGKQEFTVQFVCTGQHVSNVRWWSSGTRSPRMSDVRGSNPSTATEYALVMSSNKSETRVQCFPLDDGEGRLSRRLKKSFSCSTVSVPNRHATKRKHEGWDTRILPGCPSLDRGSRETEAVARARIYWPEGSWFKPDICISISLFRLGQPGSIPAPMLPSGGMAPGHQRGVTAEMWSSTGLINMRDTLTVDSPHKILPRFRATHRYATFYDPTNAFNQCNQNDCHSPFPNYSLFGQTLGKLDAINRTVRTFGCTSNGKPKYIIQFVVTGQRILFVLTPPLFNRSSSYSGVIILSSSPVHIQWPCWDLNPGHLTCEASVLPLLHQHTLDASEFSRLNRRTCSRLSDVIDNLRSVRHDKNTFLNEHNMYRTMVLKGMVPNQPPALFLPNLTWSDVLEGNARNEAERCAYSVTGENLPGEVRAQSRRENFDAVKNWFDQHLHYKYGRYPPENPDQVSGYTQLVWANTQTVGCYQAYCRHYWTGSTLESSIYNTVCRYWPPGNLDKEMPYELTDYWITEQNSHMHLVYKTEYPSSP
ncbi:Peptidase inhibitor 16 [Clonorchis sinensis]|uniref:Peptidase inhibitor 16 n=1 Tax=Clonorchis sinensis TaxID=79923 RepID=A0A419PJI9_CLOSI|nr:Peptidase inhibitor 16 [Clonorchis sinensis]